MNIDSIKNYPSGNNMLRLKPKYGLENRDKSTGVDLCDKKNVNRGYYGGSFTGLNGAAAKVSANALDKILDLCEAHTVIAQNLVALVLASCFRPIAIMSLPGKKNKDDKIYASGHSIASGLIGFGFSCLVMYPLGKAAKKVVESTEALKNNPKQFLTEKSKKIYGVDDLSKLKDSKSFERVTRILKMAPDVFIFGVLKAMLTVALIPPILKYVFGVEKGKKPVQQVQQQSDVKDSIPSGFSTAMVKPEISKFAGGLK